MQFKVIAGQHVDDAGRTYKAGDVVTSDDQLDATFQNKFQRLSGGAAAVLAAGADVTNKFADAVKNGFRVFRRAGKHFVYDAAGAVVNDRGVGAAEVAALITDALED